MNSLHTSTPQEATGLDSALPPVATLLAIDDDPNITAAIRRRFKPHRIEVLEACHGVHGLSLAMLKKPDLIITDLVMPCSPGEEVVACLRNNLQTRAIPIIVLTGQGNRYRQHQMDSYGVEVYLTKPVEFDELFEAVSQLIDLPGRLQA
ncbi:MAG: response regulator [Pirellulales bacterium]|nr:response regulator [Pirellulales bacterium]